MFRAALFKDIPLIEVAGRKTYRVDTLSTPRSNLDRQADTPRDPFGRIVDFLTDHSAKSSSDSLLYPPAMRQNSPAPRRSRRIVTRQRALALQLSS